MFNAEINRKLDLITRLLYRLLNEEEDFEMALQSDVQSLLDKVSANTSLVGSLKTASDGMAKQIQDLQAQLANVQPGQPVDAEDLAAIQQAVSALQQTNDSITTAVPANTPQASDPAAGASTQQASSGS